MAVRVFDLTEPQVTHLTVVEAAPRRRQEVRRTKRRWAIVGFCSLLVPFSVAALTLGVLR
jgi:hypothetical protein